MRCAVTRALLFDGTSHPPRPDQTVVWEGDRIAWVGPDGEADLSGTDTVVEAFGAALLPGLIDAHVHLCLDATVEGIDGVAAEPIDAVRRRSEVSARRLLGAGITSARDQGSHDGVAIDVARAQREGRLPGARILAAGRGITPTGGHGWMIGVEADGPAAVRAAVAEEVRRGAAVIKLFPTGGVLGSGSHGFEVVMSAEEIDAAVDEAHRHGLLAGAHVHGRPGIDLVLAAGIDTIEHATDISEAQARRAADAGIALVPTLGALDALLEQGSALPDDLMERADQVRRTAAEGIRMAISVGATVLAGTDAGTPFNPPGRLVAEMQLLASLGLGNLGAIASATSRSAEVLRLADFGKVEPGRVADLLVAVGDPGDDLTVLARPGIVVQGGRFTV
jgi:imidazolonepropionase-like amidohydrolase